jgi:hypothetical protein
MYSWVLVAMFLSPDGQTIDYTVVDYYKSKQECQIVRGHQVQKINRNLVCLPRDQV